MSTQKFRMIKNVASIALTLVLGAGVASCSGGSQEQAASADEAEVMHISMVVIGPDANGEDVVYGETDAVVADDTTDAWALSQQLFDMYGLEYDAANSDYGIMLNSITSPVDGTVLAYDEGAGTYWQLFVDGAASEVGIDGVELADGTSVVWYYSAFGDALPEGELPLVEQLADAA